MGSMTGKTAVVTGGSRGIGRAICLELARRGANVVFSYAGNTAAADKTLEELQALGVEARAVQGDVADPAAAKALIDTAVKELGGIHILVNNAGITRDGLAMAMKEEAHLRVDAFVMALPQKGQHIMRVICLAGAVLLCAAITCMSFNTTMKIMSRGQTAISIPLPIWYVWLGIPFCFALTTLQAVRRLWLALTTSEN